MIKFRARMYNVTSGEYYDYTPTDYSFAEYFGYTGVESASESGSSLLDWWLNGGIVQQSPALSEEAGNDYMLGHGGETLTNIPYTRFQFERSTNIGTWFEFYAKKYYDENSMWPVLELRTSENDILRWSHDSYNNFTILKSSEYNIWRYAFQWTDDFNNQYSDDRKYNKLYSTVFVKAAEDNDLLSVSSIIYSGAFTFNDTSGGIDTLVASGGGLFTCDLQKLTDPVVYIDQEMRYENGYPQQRNFYAGTLLPNNNFDYYYAITVVSIRNSSKYWSIGCFVFSPIDPNELLKFECKGGDITSLTTSNVSLHNTQYNYWYWYVRYCTLSNDSIDAASTPYIPQTAEVHYTGTKLKSASEFLNEISTVYNFRYSNYYRNLYDYLQGFFSIEPPSDVDPEDIPPSDEPPSSIPPDDPDPYYDPESDPTSPSYDPVKDPTSPSYDPSVPSTPYQPIIQQTITYPAPIINPPDPIPAPETPATYVNTSRLFTIFTPTVSQLTDFANFLWASPTDIVPTFRKIVANPMDCVLGLMVIPQLSFTRQSRELNIGNIGTGITMDYAPSQFVDFDCGQLFLQEYYRSYLDYSPYTKVDIFLPFIGTRELSIDECMQKTIGVTYRFDLATGTCIAFIKVNGTVLYQFEGNCASHIPLSAADWGSTVKAIPTIAVGAVKAGGLIGGGPIGALGVAAAASVMSMKERHPHAGSMSGSAGLMGVLYPYLIVTRPCQALPESQNSFTGYPSFITLSLSECSGYTEVEQVHLEHVPATGEELVEIERLLKAGVLF